MNPKKLLLIFRENAFTKWKKHKRSAFLTKKTSLLKNILCKKKILKENFPPVSTSCFCDHLNLSLQEHFAL